MLAGHTAEIRPQLDFTTELGFIYPTAEKSLGVKGKELASILESLSDKGILKKEFFDKFLRCPQCQSLNLRPSTHCPKCGREVARQTVEQMVDSIREFPRGTKLMVLAPVVRDRKGEHLAVFEDLRKAGYVRVRIDGRIYDLSEEFQLDKNKKHSIEAIVDRLLIDTETETGRVADSVETALKLGAGVVLVSIVEGEELLFSEHFACVHCGISIGEIAPRTFSFNSPHGACSECTGLGVKLEIDPNLVIPNKNLTLAEGAIQPWLAPARSVLGITACCTRWLTNMASRCIRR
jgi:excinuclease UvrABC ATPase subunit